jgi:hypothetical protein
MNVRYFLVSLTYPLNTAVLISSCIPFACYKEVSNQIHVTDVSGTVSATSA